MSDPDTSLRARCLAILASGELDAKLAPLPADLDDAQPGPAVDVDGPERAPAIAFAARAPRLPLPRELGRPEARIACLARFAHHELMAVELFAWALLRFPDAPAALRRGLARVIGEEQLHCRLYLARLDAHGARLEGHAHVPYFWNQVPALRASPHGIAAFLAGMGLTLEQANLDFTLLWRDAFRAAGDEPSARVCQRVHDDEVGHVRFAAEWLRRLAPGADDAERYARCAPFPLGANRAKGRRFAVAPRERAGLDRALIEHVRRARARPGARRAPRADDGPTPA
ncbi:MAG: DUF455 family protein [Myxococcota bacterium]